MNRTLAVLAGALVVVSAILVVGRMADDSGDPRDLPTTSAEERERVSRFWRLHREAGAMRIAGDVDGATERYEQALALMPDHEDALYYLSNSYIEADRLSDARRMLVRLTEAHPASARGHARLGELHLCYPDPAVFDTDRARASLTRAIQLNQEETGPMIRLAQAALLARRFEDARRWLEAVIGTHSTNAEAHFLLGYVAWTQNSPEAARHFDHARRLIVGDEEADPVVGEGDRKNGGAMRLGELSTCPAMLDVIAGLTDPASAPTPDAAYSTGHRRLEQLRRLEDPGR